MRLWLIFVQADDYTWLEAAWTDDMTASNPDGWEAEVDRVDEMCRKNDDHRWRVCSTLVDGVFGLFDNAELRSSPAEGVD